MTKIKNKSKIILLIILFLIILGVYSCIRIFKSYSYISNTELIRTIIKNTAGFYYDRGGYIQFDSSSMNESDTIKRSEYFSYFDANRDTIKYLDQVGFINNVFKTGINLDLNSIIGKLNLDSLKKFGQQIYNEKNQDDKRLNVSFDNGEYTIDYYDNQVVRLSGSMTAIEDNHYLVMYVQNQELTDFQKKCIFDQLKSSLYIGDILVFDQSILLYIGNNLFMYASGTDYDYNQGIDYYENNAIKIIDINNLNILDHEMYLYNAQEFYVYRFLNKTGYWTSLPVSYQALKSYYSNEIVPTIKLEKFGSKANNSDIYFGDELTITIKITNNSANQIIIPIITDIIDSSQVEYLSNNYINEAYLDGNLTFTEIAIEGNNYREISYQVKVIANDGIVDFGSTKIGNYRINNLSYKVAPKIDFTRLINGQADIFTNYKKLYNITLPENIVPDNASEFIVSNFYGGKKLSDYPNRAKYINSNILVTGDIIFFDEHAFMYINDDDKAYLVDHNNQKLNENVEDFFRSLLGKERFIIIRPSYLYDDIINKFGDLVVDHGSRIIYVKQSCSYQTLIEQLSSDLQIMVTDPNNNLLNLNDYIKTGSKLIISDNEYYLSLLGDINGDGLINTGDVLKLHRYVLGKIETMDKCYLASSYINGDDLINTGDVLKLHRYVLGKVTSLE